MLTVFHVYPTRIKKVTNPHQAKTCLLAVQDALSEIIMRMRNQRDFIRCYSQFHGGFVIFHKSNRKYVTWRKTITLFRFFSIFAHRTLRLIRVCTVCVITENRGLNKTVLSPRSAPFSQPTLKDNRSTSAVSALIDEMKFYKVRQNYAR